jgi:outer membrane protein OmpA-like peptidoglycan-associated protein
MRRIIILLICMFSSANAFSQNNGDFGNKNAGIFNLKGNIYFISDTTGKMPLDIEKQKSEGLIYTTRLDIPKRDFTEGFPGVSNRFEYFGLIYKGVFEITEPGDYYWRLSSDDGSILWVDNKIIIDNDGVHGENSIDSEMNLNKGLHSIKVWYFQGPATEIALQLFVKEPGSETEEIFDISKYNARLREVVKKLNAIADKDGIRILLPDKILFESGKSDLKSESEDALNAFLEIFNVYPEATVIVEGHTDNIGNAAVNLKLSVERAESVVNGLKAKKIPQSLKFETKGSGSTKPVANNSTEEGRTKNRRVEILIIP